MSLLPPFFTMEIPFPSPQGGEKDISRSWLFAMTLLIAQAVSQAAFASSSQEGAESKLVTLSGSNQITFQIPGKKGTGRYCVKYNQARQLEQKWRVVFVMPAGGLKLKPVRQYASSVPFELTIEPAQGGRPVTVHDGSVLHKGNKLTSHCSDPGDAFYLKVAPAIATELIPGGAYSQQLQLKLYVDDIEEDTFEIQLSLEVAERVKLEIPGILKLPDFDGHNPAHGEVKACVFRNGGGHYAIRMRGEGEHGSFILSDGREQLDFQALWRSGTHPAERLDAGETSQTYLGSSYPDCHGSSNATVLVHIPAEDARQVTSGHYQGLLRITVETR